MRRIHAGKLDTRLTLERFKTDAEENSHGEIDYSDPATFEAVGERWAAIETGNGSERTSQSLVQAGATHRIVMRYDRLTCQLNAFWRLRKGQRGFGVISAVNEDEKREWMVIDVEEAVIGSAD